VTTSEIMFLGTAMMASLGILLLGVARFGAWRIEVYWHKRRIAVENQARAGFDRLIADLHNSVDQAQATAEVAKQATAEVANRRIH